MIIGRYLKFYLGLSTLIQISSCVDLTYLVKEGQIEGTFLGNIAKDADIRNKVEIENGAEITFHLVTQTPENFQLFRVDKTTGKLYTARMLDAESLCKHNSKECFKLIDVVVRSLKFFIKLLEVKVIILDINEYPPQFPDKEIYLQFYEDVIPGTKISIPNAKDNDVGILNSQISYEFKKGKKEPFALHILKNIAGTFELSIILEERLDREIEDSYTVQVVARDGGSPPKENILNVHISVVDVNDNFPTFSQSVYTVSISNKHDPTTPVFILSAKDKDIGVNGKILYSISSETSERVRNLFNVDEDNGKIFMNKNLPTQTKSVNKLYVKATDRGTPPLNSVAMVLVNVINEQNNAPIIDVNSILLSKGNTFKITEDVSVGSFIAYVRVTDHDTGDNGNVQCDLHHGKFQLQNISEKKYKLTIKNPLDRELEDHHDITISCQDKGFPPLHTDYKLTVHVEDVNDEPPRPFQETFKFDVQETEEANISVGFINATDRDLGTGSKLSFSVLSHNERFLPFRITNNGFITTLIGLDHEIQDSYQFKVLVKDHGTPSLNSTVNVIINIIDKNDNAPYFIFPNTPLYKMEVLYYPQQSKNITVLKAADRDSNENAFLTYEITRGNEKQLFSIDRYTGRLYSAHVLQKENAGSYELEFVVKDSGNPFLSATTTLLLVLKINNRTKTAEMANSVQIIKNDKMQVNLVITITIVAVIISIVITASISVCVLRCNNNQNSETFYNDLNPSKQGLHDQRYLMYPTYQSTTWPGIYMTIDKSANGRSSALKRELCQGYEFGNGQNGAPIMVKPWLPTDITCQMCVQDVSTTVPNCTNNENTGMMPEEFSWIPTMSSCPENGQKDEGTDSFPTQYCTRSLPTANKLHATAAAASGAERKPIQETFSHAGDTCTLPRSFYKKIIDQNNLQKDRTNPETTATENNANKQNSEMKTTPTNTIGYSNCRPLPPLPNNQL